MRFLNLEVVGEATMGKYLPTTRKVDAGGAHEEPH